MLVAAVQQEYVQRYGGMDDTPVEPAEFAPPRGFFIVGYVADERARERITGTAPRRSARPCAARECAARECGTPVACGGWRARDGTAGPPLRDGDVEIKRMFVPAAHRGRGYARAVLAELERTAAAAGHRRAVLETGTRQPEAMALYASAGYVPMPRFGHYRDSPNCRCFAKGLPPHRP